MMIPFNTIAQADELLEAAIEVTTPNGGYIFAVMLLVIIVFALSAAILKLWNTIQSKDTKYSNLAQSTTAMLTEVNMKLDNQDEIKQKIEKVIDLVQELKRL